MFRPFGSSTTTGGNIFGTGAAGQQASQTSGGIFGGGIGGGMGVGASTTTGLGGATGGGFGMNPFGGSAGSLSMMGGASTTTGTGNPPYTSTTDQEGSLTITLYCISAMPAYRGKSLEELRLEDYLAGKKGASSFGSTVAPASSVFGAQPPGGATGGSMFGQPAASTSSVFGAKPAFGSAFGQPAATPAATTGAFSGGSAFGGSAFGAPTTSAFGQPQAAGTSMFSQPAAAAPAASGFTFGQPAAAPAATSAFGGFGQAAQPAAATNPFGAPKPATPFGFGSTATTPAAAPASGFSFGQPQQPATSAFGFGAAAQPAPAQTSAFGQPQPAQAQTGFSFGQPQQQQPPSTGFGFNAPSTGTAFGQTTAQPSQPTGFSFGQPAQQPATQPTSLFGAQPAATAAPTGGLGFFNKPAGTSFGFGTSTQTATPAPPLSFGFGQTTAAAGQAAAQPQSNLPFIGQPDASLLSLKPPIPSGLLATPSSTSAPETTSAAPSTAPAPPARIATSMTPRLSGFRPKSRAETEPTFNIGNLVPKKVSIKKLAIPQSSSADGTASKSESGATVLDAAGEPASLKHSECYMIPDASVLKKMSFSQLSAVPNLVIGQKGVGRIKFLQPVDLTTVDIDSILDDIVVFGNNQVVLYPEDEFHHSDRPLPGQGLNVPAECRLERCWPTCRSTRDPITEMGTDRMRRHIQRLQEVKGTQFIDYFPETGTWIFKVEHF